MTAAHALLAPTGISGSCPVAARTDTQAAWGLRLPTGMLFIHTWVTRRCLPVFPPPRDCGARPQGNQRAAKARPSYSSRLDGAEQGRGGKRGHISLRKWKISYLCKQELKQSGHTVLEVQQRWCFPVLLLTRKGFGKGHDGLGPLTHGSVPALCLGTSWRAPFEGSF